MKRLVAILIAFSFVLAFSVYAEAFRAPAPGRLPPHPRDNGCCGPKSIQLINQTFTHHMDLAWQHNLVQVVQLVPMYIPLESERVEREDTCIGDSWAKKKEEPKPVPPPVAVPPPPKPVPVPPPVVKPVPVQPPPPPVVKPVPPPVKPVPPPVVKPKPVLDPVIFDIAKTNINPIGANALNKNGAVMKEYPNMKVEIGGHTDSTGSEAANKVISEKRAKSCKQYLMDKFNISGDRMATKGYGSSKPIGDNKTREGREKNRRVEFQIISY